MTIQILSEDVQLRDDQILFIQEKIGNEVEKHLRTFDEGVKHATVRVEKQPHGWYKLDFDMWLPRKGHIFANAVAKRVKLGATELRDKIKTQVSRYREKLNPWK